MKLYVYFLFYLYINCLNVYSLIHKFNFNNKIRLKVSLNEANEITYNRLNIQTNDNITIGLTQTSKLYNVKNPILFIHGSFHGSWCFEENFMSYYTNNKYDCYAVNLRGTSLSPTLYDKSIKINEHLSDLNVVIDYIESLHNKKVVIIAHSLGGIIVMKLMDDSTIRSKIRAIALLCSVPPSGNGPMTLRFLRNKFIGSLKIILGFVFKQVINNEKLCRTLFFDDSISSSDIQKYMSYFELDSKVTIDLKDLSSQLPYYTTANPKTRVADWIDQNTDISRIVIGASNDFIVDNQGVDETARYLNVSSIYLNDMYHDVMLGSKWTSTASILLSWLKSI